MSKKVLLTSVCRPMGRSLAMPRPSLRAALPAGHSRPGHFQSRTVNVQFGLDYIAENLDVPTVVLQYPSKRELIKELKKGYDYVACRSSWR